MLSRRLGFHYALFGPLYFSDIKNVSVVFDLIIVAIVVHVICVSVRVASKYYADREYRKIIKLRKRYIWNTTCYVHIRIDIGVIVNTV